MYRDDPLPDEEELRAIVGDADVDRLLDASENEPVTAFDVAVDILRVLQGWAGDDEVGEWFRSPQTRLDGRTPVRALCGGDHDDVREAARRWAAAHA